MSKIRTEKNRPTSNHRTIDGLIVPIRMSFLIVPRFNMATLITMIEPLRIANYLSPVTLYDWEILSLDGLQVVASNGLTINANSPSERNRRGEMLFLLASWGAENYHNKDMFSWIRRQAREGVQMCSVELGCYILAKTGLLVNKRVATHWSWSAGFAEEFSNITVVEQLFINDEGTMSCAGGLAGVDFILKLISQEHGDAVAGEVADQMLYHPVRQAHTPQRRTLGHGVDTLNPIVSQVINLIESNITDPPSVPSIAEALNVSQRQLERQFHNHIGCSVVQFSTLCRLQHARVLLISTKLSVRDVAVASGFNTLSHFAFTFKKCFGRRPSDYRQAWPKEDSAPTWPGTLATFVERIQFQAKKNKINFSPSPNEVRSK